MFLAIENVVSFQCLGVCGFLYVEVRSEADNRISSVYSHSVRFRIYIHKRLHIISLSHTHTELSANVQNVRSCDARNQQFHFRPMVSLCVCVRMLFCASNSNKPHLNADVAFV